MAVSGARAGSTGVMPIQAGKVYRLADELSAKHRGSRTLDLLHVASAVSLKSKTFLTFDARQTTLAKAAGLRVRP